VTTDKTGAPTTVTPEHHRYTIAVDGQTVGRTQFADRGKQRVFLHTEVDDKFEGRGLATILVNEALSQTKAEGLRIVAVCPMVAAFLDKHEEFDDVRDPITDDIENWLLSS
jgi:uncharacterized protein